MTLSYEQLISSINQKKPQPVIWLEGEEPWFGEQVVKLAEESLLTETEKAFGLEVLYGRDANATQVINACRQYPMGSDRQVVILKEAQSMDSLEDLEPYVRAPMPSTVLVVMMAGKKLDGKKRFKKYMTDKTAGHVALLSAEKLKESQVRQFVGSLAQSRGLKLDSGVAELMESQIGNDLNRLENEFDKLQIVLQQRDNVTLADVEEYVGISREYNAFELTNSITQRNLPKALKIIDYFEQNPKAGPLQMLLPPIYTFFARLQAWHDAADKSSPALKAIFYNNPYQLNEAAANCRGFYSRSVVDKGLLLVHEYNLKSIGIHSSYGVSNGQLLRELVIKLIS